MTRRHFALTVAALWILLPSTTARGAQDVTATAAAQHDLAAAIAYWREVRPDLTPPACPIRLEVAEMGPAEVAPGQLIPGTDAWAETDLHACTMRFSAEIWSRAIAYEPVNEATVCTVVVHEYGHVLGLPDTAEVGEMNAYPEQRPYIAQCWPHPAATVKVTADYRRTRKPKRRRKHGHA